MGAKFGTRSHKSEIETESPISLYKLLHAVLFYKVLLLLDRCCFEIPLFKSFLSQ